MIRTSHEIICDICDEAFPGYGNLEGVARGARDAGWVVSPPRRDATCPACIGKAVENVERNVSKEAANAKQQGD